MASKQQWLLLGDLWFLGHILDICRANLAVFEMP